MIPFDYITEWRAEAPWIDDAQVEQDLVISRALVEIFRHPTLADSLALRGGTALSKLQLRPPARYSEDIDLVQATAQPAGPMMNALRAVLEPWLGKPKWKQGEGRITFYFRYTAEGASPVPMRLKVETNTREHFALYAFGRLRSRSPRGGSRARARSRLTSSTNCSAPSSARSTSASRRGTCSTSRSPSRAYPWSPSESSPRSSNTWSETATRSPARSSNRTSH